jgi:hypothetical protein
LFWSPRNSFWPVDEPTARYESLSGRRERSVISSIASQKSFDGFVVPAPCMTATLLSSSSSTDAAEDDASSAATCVWSVAMSAALSVPTTSAYERRLAEMTYFPAPICGSVLLAVSVVKVGMPSGVVIVESVTAL